MAQVLHQNEVDALINAVSAGDVEEDCGEVQVFSRFRRDLDDVEIRDYDFKRPERISKDQIRALQTLHETFARNFGASLSGFLRTIIEVSVSQVEQMTYAEFIDGLPNPTSFNLIDPDTLDGTLCLELSPLIVYPIVDRLLGGTSQDLFIPQRAMTAIETRLISQILQRAVSGLAEVWANVHPIRFTLGEMESNPQLVQIVPPNEVVVVIRFELKMNKRAGTMSLCVPFNVIEPLMPTLSAQSWFSAARGKGRDSWHKTIGERLHDAPLALSADLASTTITMHDLRHLEVGDVIVTDKPAKDAIVVCIEGRPKYLGRIGQVKGRRAVRIDRAIRTGERL